MGYLTEKIESQINRWIWSLSVEKKSTVLGEENLRSQIEVVVGNGNK
jgi:hypothetical protein